MHRKFNANFGCALSISALPLVIALACSACHAQTGTTDLRIVSQAATQKLKRTDTIEVTLSRDVLPSDGQIAICVGPLDLSAQTKAAGPRTFRAQAADDGLPPGTQEVVVHLIRGDQWIDIGKYTIEVEGDSEQKETSKGLEARFTFNIKGQVHEKVSGTTQRGKRGNFQDVNLTSANTYEGKPLGFDLKATANLTGVSNRQEAIRFGIDANEAQKLDLNDYKMEFGAGDVKFVLGHLSYGNHPLLINNRESRGLSASYAITPWLDVSMTAMRATSIVGFQDFFGLALTEHRIYAATTGLELIPSKKGLLRAEALFLTAKALPQSNIGQGQIPDAEQSRGIGFRLASADSEGRWKADALFARSRYLNPTHPDLAQGSALVPVKAETRDAYQADASYLILNDLAWLGERWKTNVRMVAHYAYSEPLFKSLGSDFIADQQLFRYGAEGKLGEIDIKWYASRKNDNVKTIPTILKTGTYERDSQLAVPLPQILGTQEKPANAWPQVQLRMTRVYQYTLRAPDGTNARSSLWPDQMNRTHKAGLNWSYDPFTVGYSLEVAHQDNRQPERERADFLIHTHGLNLGWRVNEKLSFNGSFNRSRNFSYEKTQATYNNGGSANVDWQIDDHWSVKLDYSKTLAYDSRDEQYSNVVTTSFQVIRKFEFERLGRKWPGQVFVRVAFANNRALDGIVKQVLKGKQTLVQTGFSMNF